MRGAYGSKIVYVMLVFSIGAGVWHFLHARKLDQGERQEPLVSSSLQSDSLSSRLKTTKPVSQTSRSRLQRLASTKMAVGGALGGVAGYAAWNLASSRIMNLVSSTTQYIKEINARDVGMASAVVAGIVGALAASRYMLNSLSSTHSETQESMLEKAARTLGFADKKLARELDMDTKKFVLLTARKFELVNQLTALKYQLIEADASELQQELAKVEKGLEVLTEQMVERNKEWERKTKKIAATVCVTICAIGFAYVVGSYLFAKTTGDTSVTPGKAPSQPSQRVSIPSNLVTAAGENKILVATSAYESSYASQLIRGARETVLQNYNKLMDYIKAAIQRRLLALLPRVVSYVGQDVVIENLRWLARDRIQQKVAEFGQEIIGHGHEIIQKAGDKLKVVADAILVEIPVGI